MRTRFFLVSAAVAVLGCSADDSGAGGTDGGSFLNGGMDGSNPLGPIAEGGVVLVPNEAGVLPEAGIDPSQAVVIDKCQPGVNGAPDKATIDQLTAASGGGAAPRVLYPYDGTVFPRGMAGPTIMWEGTAGPTSAVHVRISAPNFEYRGCGGTSAQNQFQIPADVWDIAGKKTQGKAFPFKVELRLQAGGKVVGPITTSWTIAKATIKGSIYYNSYSSLKGIPGIGKVLRIQPGKEAEAYIMDGCNGCHSVSANGKRLSSMTLLTAGMSFDISNAMPRRVATPARSAYAALTPDGTKQVIGSAAMDVARSNWTSPAGGGFPDATLLNTDTGAAIQATGLPKGALMPSFSSDGKLLVFSDAQTQATTIGAVDYDGNTTFANQRVIYTDTGGMKPGWPFLLPDNQGIVFVRTPPLNDWSANGAGALGGALTAGIGPYSELFMVDVDTGKNTLLAKAMGFNTVADAAAKNSYLPFREQDYGKAYFPTVSPVAAGGYFWVFFDAVRNYGNMGVGRQLWGTAIEISPNGDYSVDRSNPAFYIPGQEWGTGNHRAFTALDACKVDGDNCTSGVDCCGGFCTIVGTELGSVGKCSSTAACAKLDERCKTSMDCCATSDGAPNACIAGFCAQVPVLN